MGMRPGAVQLLQVLCMGMGASLNLHQNQSARDPWNITMMQPKERGLKSLLDRAHSSDSLPPPANGSEGPQALQDLPGSASAPPKLPAVPEVQPEVGPKEIPSLPAPQATSEKQEQDPLAGAQPAVLENDAVTNHEQPITLRESMEKLKQARLTTKGAGTARDRNTKRPLKRPASAM